MLIFFVQIKLPLGMEQFIHLKFGNITFSGNPTLIQFKVTNVSAGISTENLLTVEIYLQRMFYYHLATTYLPTVCLLIIAEITLFIDESHFDTTIMVSLTAMLVMYTLYQSISGTLPQTAYLKMIDVWLLFGLLMPFVVFLFEVIWNLAGDTHIDKYGNVHQPKDTNGPHLRVWRSKPIPILKMKSVNICIRLQKHAKVLIPIFTVACTVIYWTISLTFYFFW